MKKKIFLLSTILAAMTLAGCSSHDETSLAGSSGNTASGGSGDAYSVNFSAYTGRSVSRAGTAGELVTSGATGSQIDLQTEGFGVFAYYTDLKKYDQTYAPNFMYNTKVTYSAGSWTYSPLMYWPNEYGSNAGSDDEDKVSFFAYAPYVAVTSGASGNVDGDATSGITGFSRNTTAGDPIVKYIASFDPSESVDLCWGVCAQDKWDRIEGSSQAMTAGLPWLDVEHPKAVAQDLTFTFKHALAQLNVQIDADVDVAEHSDGDALDASTKIFVRSISFTGIAMQGALNLNNSVANKAQWLDYAGTTDLPYGQSVTIKDGRRDGREGAAGAEATNETPQGLNSDIIQKETATTGVTTTLKNLFNDASTTKSVYVIPTGETMTVTIVYDVETESDDLASYISDGTTHGSSIENRITRTISFGEAGKGLASGNKYTLKLHLGMNSVQYTADVADWDDGETNGDAWLPSNQPSLTMSSEGAALGSSLYFAATGDGAAKTIDAATFPDNTVDVTWTIADSDIATIASADPAPTRAGTRASATVTARSVKVTPQAVGTTTLTATSILGTTTIPVYVGEMPLSAVTSEHVGWIICSNGCAVKPDDPSAELTCTHKKVAIISYVGATGTVDYSTTVDGSKYRGLALSMKDASDGADIKWYTENSGTHVAQNSTIGTVLSSPSTYMKGIDFTNTLAGGCDAGHTHQAATVAKDWKYDESVEAGAHPDATSQWFLPAIGQWNLIVKSICGDNGNLTTSTNNSYKGTVFSPKLVEYGGDGAALKSTSGGYWSSVEFNTNYAWNMSFNLGYAFNYSKSNNSRVRPVLAF